MKNTSKESLKIRDEILSGTKNKKEQFKKSCYEVMVHKLCNEKCFFCSQDHNSRTQAEKPNDNDIYKRILFGAREGYGMLGFTGGEPLTHPHILNYIKFGRKAGFDFVRIQTNGTMLGVSGFAEKCVKAGATFFKLSVHHYKPEIHDYLVGLPGALNNILFGIKELKRLGARIGINIVLTEQNYRDLPDFLLYYLDKGINSFVIILPLYENSMKDEIKKVGFKFTDTLPFIIKSLLIFDKLGLKRPLVLNMPMCLMPEYENAIIQTFNGTTVSNLDGSKTNIDDNKAGGKKRVPICQDCSYNKICFGVDEKYLSFWGEAEFQEKKKTLGLKYDLSDLHIKEYFSEDELCFFELLSLKNPLNIEDIIELKADIQICQDCDSTNKILSTAEILIKKGYIKRELKNGKIIYSKLSQKYV